MIDFDPRCPPTTNSLNRLRLAAATLPGHVRGKSGYELVSTRAVNTLIQPYTTEIAQFYEQVAVEADWAIEIAHMLGTRLGCLLFVLVCNDAQTHQANADKPAAFWGHWSGIHTIYLGGGLVQGKVGEIVASQAQETLQQLSNKPIYRVIQGEHPQHLPLLGAARIVQSGSRASILDFGGSYVKRAFAHYTTNMFSRLQIRESLPSDLPAQDIDAQLIFERMVDIIVQSYGDVDAPTIPISIAAYVNKHGQPWPIQGGHYAQLSQLTSDVPAAFSRAASDRLGKAVEVVLLHDGTAAALYYVPGEHTAVIMIGTALGSGYAVPRPNLLLRPVSPTLTVEEV